MLSPERVDIRIATSFILAAIGLVGAVLGHALDRILKRLEEPRDG